MTKRKTFTRPKGYAKRRKITTNQRKLDLDNVDGGIVDIAVDHPTQATCLPEKTTDINEPVGGVPEWPTFGPYRFGEGDVRALLEEGGFLTDNHMNRYGSMIEAEFGYRLRDVLLWNNPQHIAAVEPGSNHLQFIFDGTNNSVGHWVTAFYDGGVVRVYDSIPSRQLGPSANIFLQHLFPFVTSYEFPTVQAQTNVYDCGCFAIAFATSVLLNRDPTEITYDCRQLRTHLAYCFQTNRITHFPEVARRVLPVVPLLSMAFPMEQEQKDIGYVAKEQHPLRKSFHAARQNDFVEADVPAHSVGDMRVICVFCNALHFKGEETARGLKNCCHFGRVEIPSATTEPFPELLEALLTDGHHRESRRFRENVRRYNSALAFASMGAQVQLPAGRGPFVFRIHGQIYHNTFGLHPNRNAARVYAQLYILETEEACRERMVRNPDCSVYIMRQLDQLLRNVNPYAKAYNMMKDVEEAEEAAALLEGRAPMNVRMFIVKNRDVDQRRFNVPTANEVAVVFVGNDGEPPANRDFAVYPRTGRPYHLPVFSPNVDPMVYPLLFPFGELGWSPDRLMQRHTLGMGAIRVSMLQFYMYKLATRPSFNACLHAGRLTQQYVVDAYCKVEGNRLNYIKYHQAKLRSDHYGGLFDYIKNRSEREEIPPGKMVILPSTFIGSPRSLFELFQDSMAIVRKHGIPDLFVTFTCNPKWPDIQNQLTNNETAADRPDIVARVFHLKCVELMKRIREGEIFGGVEAFVYVIEFQKRGLPHMHLLVFLVSASKPKDSSDYDKIVCAEIPDPVKEPRLHDLVRSCMVHGPCGSLNPSSVCMVNNQCSKKFPKEFSKDTIRNAKGYPLYRRRDDGRSVEVDRKRNVHLDNRWIVPYNRYLLCAFEAHINVEVCSSIQSIKYLFKYMLKGYDCAAVHVTTEGVTLDYDEVGQFISARYVCPPEAMHRLLEYPMHRRSHAIKRLPVHLPGEELLFFREGEEEAAVRQHKSSLLTAWFDLNQRDTEARKYLYVDIPNVYVDETVHGERRWRRRYRLIKPVLTRLIFANPNGERGFLRTLLLHVPGAQSFEELRTVDGVLYPTFREAAVARHLVGDDDVWEKCLEEAVTIRFPKQLRALFVYICVFCNPSQPHLLYLKFKSHFFFKGISEAEAERRCLRHMEYIFQQHGMSLRDIPNMPHPDSDVGPSDIEEWSAESDDVVAMRARDSVEKLTETQRIVYNAVQRALNDPNEKQRYFFVDGAGGSGKTFLYNCLIDNMQVRGQRVVAMAWTGIAANLLRGGRTVHSTFKLPIPLTETSTSSIKANSGQADYLRNASLIIWDEISMALGHAMRVVDLLLRDITRQQLPFGGKVILVGGDFRQCLPVVKHGNRTLIVESSVKSCSAWDHFQRFALIGNKRLLPNEYQFAQWLLQVGEGRTSSDFEKRNGLIQIPSEILVPGGPQALIVSVFGDKQLTAGDRQLETRAILCTTNATADIFNELMVARLSGETKIYLSADSALSEDDADPPVPVEFMNNITPSGMPPHRLVLKKGCVVMLLRNVDASIGLCNGTRLIVVDMLELSVVLQFLSEQRSGERVMIPRMELKPSDTDLPFQLIRLQLPLKVCYAMTVNKAQGQSFESIGLHLPSPAFSHGQLYVAFSRVRSAKGLKVQLSSSSAVLHESGVYTANCVYPEIL